MKSDFCRNIRCPFFGKFSGKAVCRAAHPKQFIKHLTKCQQVLNTGDGFVIAGANTQTK